MRTILHVDLNNFYASVECLYRPELRTLPVAVAGNPENRHGIILAKNMIAKNLGIKTGETIWQAKLKAPKLIMVPPDFGKYLKFSRLAKNIYYDYTDKIEAFGIDECWLDVTGSIDLFGSGEKIAEAIRTRIREELGVTVSIGVSFNKIFAKLGSDMKKPDATTIISQENFKKVVWPLPVEDLLYVGRSTSHKLHNCGLNTIGKLASADVSFLHNILGKWGNVLWIFANGLDSSPVSKFNCFAGIKSIGNSTTSSRDLENTEDVKLVFIVLTESIAARLRESGLKCTAIQISVRDNKLFGYTRQTKLSRPTYLSSDLIKAANDLLNLNYTWERPLRSIGIRAIELVTATDHLQLSLFEQNNTDQLEGLENAIDKIRSRFGHTAVFRGACLLDTKLTGFNPKEDHTIHPVNFFK